MTLRYKLFGIPGTFQEFVDKTKKQNEDSVEIAIQNSYQDYGISYDQVILKARNAKFKYGEQMRGLAGFSEGLSALELASEVSKDLEKCGLTFTITGMQPVSA